MPPRGRTRTWLRRLAGARSGQILLYWYSVLEAAFVPIPFEAILAPYMLIRPEIRWRLAAIGVAGYATVAVAAYLVGALFFETVGEPVLEAMGWRETYESMNERLLDAGFLAVAFVVALPIPTMPVHVSAGVVGVPIEHVLVSVLIVRGARYFGTGLLVTLYGERVLAWFARQRGTAKPPGTDSPGR